MPGTAPRTLVVSDLHLGTRTGRDVLRRPELRTPLLERLASVDRLVLLGDVVELRHGPAREALAVAEPVLRELGDALGPGKEVVVVPGNHDHNLAEPWLERRRRDAPPGPLGLESAVDWAAGETLARIAGWLAPADVRAAYPGVWLRNNVYAMHGHYGDRHTTVPMFERLGAGAMARIAREPDGGPHTAEQYEAVLAPLYAWIHELAQGGGPDLGRSSHGASAVAWRALAGGGRRGARARRARAGRRLRRGALVAAFPLVVATINRAGLGPVRRDISGPALRRASLAAAAEVVARLGVGAGHVVFGHTHRAGPLPADDRLEWLAAGGAQLHNTGSWVYEPGFLGEGPGPGQPYWPGYAVALGEAGSPQLLSLLGDRDRGDFSRP